MFIHFFSGWQPRWFVLDGGTLSYYDSQEDAWKGCKGSIKISVCEIQGLYSSPSLDLWISLCYGWNLKCLRTSSLVLCSCVLLVHASDSTRVDLTIPGEQYFYLRAINAAERQKWLVALGTAKACLTDNRTKREKGILTALITPTQLVFYCKIL